MIYFKIIEKTCKTIKMRVFYHYDRWFTINMSDVLDGKVKEKPENYVFGRPTSYKPEYCQMLINHCTEGFTFETFAGLIDVCENTLTNWTKEYPDFLRAKNQAKSKMLLCDVTTLNQGAKGLIENYNAASQIFKMKAVHKWSDKQEIDLNSNNKNINVNSTVDLTKLSDEELNTLNKIVEKASVNADQN